MEKLLSFFESLAVEISDQEYLRTPAQTIPTDKERAFYVENIVKPNLLNLIPILKSTIIEAYETFADGDMGTVRCGKCGSFGKRDDYMMHEHWVYLCEKCGYMTEVDDAELVSMVETLLNPNGVHENVRMTALKTARELKRKLEVID